MTVRYIPQITAIVYELLAAGNKKLTQKKKISLLQILKQTWFNKENQKHWIFSGFWVWILYHNIESKKLNNLVEYWWNDWKKLKTWFAESLEQRFHETGYFFLQPENIAEYSLEDTSKCEVLQSWEIKIVVHTDAKKLVWNNIITFLFRRQFLLHKWPVSQMQYSKWKALNI